MTVVAAIARRDARAIWVSAFGVGCAAGFVAVSGVFLVVDLRSNQARLDQWFGSLFVVVALLASLLTVRSFAEEERTGSLELLLTMPVSPWQLVVGKLIGATAAVLAAVAAADVRKLEVAAETAVPTLTKATVARISPM